MQAFKRVLDLTCTGKEERGAEVVEQFNSFKRLPNLSN